MYVTRLVPPLVVRLSPGVTQGSVATNVRWFVIEAHATDGSPQRAHRELAAAGFDVWMPFDLKRHPDRRAGSAKPRPPRADIRSPRFGRYFFLRCHMTDSILEAVVGTASVSDILRYGGTHEPAIIPDEYIAYLRHAKIDPVRDADFVAGDIVRMKEGPFRGFDGKVLGLDKHGILKVEVSLFGRPSVIPVEAGHVEIVKPAKSRAIRAVKNRAANRASGAAA